MSGITLMQMYSTLGSLPGRNVSLSDQQRRIIEHSSGPLWIIAGPGSGKSEVLVLRCLKLLFVDSVDPRSIIITTFTEKAARNLKDRLINYKSYLAQKFNHIEDIEVFQLRVGTLHSLCNSIMIEYRYRAYKNYRPLDELDQLLFIYFNVNLVKKSDNPSSKNKYTERELKFWTDFYDLLEKMDWRTRLYKEGEGLPRRWTRARFLQNLFNRIVEDRIDITKMQKKGGKWKVLSEAYQEYVEALEQNLRVDFAHIQKKFLDFLATPLGQRFIYGDHASDMKPLEYVLVDEYQDTPI